MLLFIRKLKFTYLFFGEQEVARLVLSISFKKMQGARKNKKNNLWD